MSDSKEQLRESFIKRASAGELTREDIEGMYKQAIHYSNEYKRNREGFVPKQYAGRDYGRIAYNYILNNGGTAEEALIHAAREIGESEEWVTAVKHNPFFYTKDVIKQADKHPTQKRLLRNKMVDRVYLSSSDTVYKLVNRVSFGVALDKAFQGMDERITALEETKNEMTIELASLQYRVKHLEEIHDIPEDPKALAQFMKEQGLSQKQVAEHLNNDVRTIRRWWGT